MRNYFARVHDYLHDPFFPASDRRKPWVLAAALWHCLFNAWMYDDEKRKARIAEMLKRHEERKR